MTKTEIGTVTITNGQGSINYTVPGDATGEKTISGVYQENNTHEQATGTGILYIRIPTTITMDNTIYASTGETITLTANIQHHTNQNVETGQVQFQLDGANIGSLVNVVEGVATLQYEVPSNITSGATITALYIQNEIYATSETSSTLQIRENINIVLNDLSFNRGTSNQITAGVTDSDGDIINIGTAVLYVDNIPQGEPVNVTDGSVTFDYNVSQTMQVGQHTIKVEYQQNNTYNQADITANMIIRTPTVLEPVNVSANKGRDVTVKIRVNDEQGSPIREGDVIITVGNGNGTTATVDANGEATITYTVPADTTGGTQIAFRGEYIENTNYQGSETSTNGIITVRKGVIVEVDNVEAVLGETITLGADVTDENNEAVTSGTIDFSIE